MHLNFHAAAGISMEMAQGNEPFTPQFSSPPLPPPLAVMCCTLAAANFLIFRARSAIFFSDNNILFIFISAPSLLILTDFCYLSFPLVMQIRRFHVDVTFKRKLWALFRLWLFNVNHLVEYTVFHQIEINGCWNLIHLNSFLKLEFVI